MQTPLDENDDVASLASERTDDEDVGTLIAKPSVQIAEANSIRTNCKHSMARIVSGDITYVQPFILALIAYLNTDMPDPNNRMAFVSHISSRTTNVLSDLLQVGEQTNVGLDTPTQPMIQDLREQTPMMVKALKCLQIIQKNRREVGFAIFGIAVAHGGIARALACGYALRQGTQGYPLSLLVLAMFTLLILRIHSATALAAIAGFAMSDEGTGGRMAGIATLCYAILS